MQWHTGLAFLLFTTVPLNKGWFGIPHHLRPSAFVNACGLCQGTVPFRQSHATINLYDQKGI